MVSPDVLDPTTCPLCGEANACGLVADRGDCWCGSTEVSRELLQVMARHGLDGACLCRRCLSGRVPTPCVGICALDDAGTTCVGCLRTLDDVRAWRDASLARRVEILLRVRSAGARPRGDGGAEP